MQVIKDNKTLAEAIANLERQKKSEGNLLKEHFNFTVHSLNPVNIIKEKFNDVVNEPGITGKILKTAIGFASGYFSNKFLFGSLNNPVAKMVTSIVESKLSNLPFDTTKLKDQGVSILSKTLQKLKFK